MSVERLTGIRENALFERRVGGRHLGPLSPRQNGEAEALLHRLRGDVKGLRRLLDVVVALDLAWRHRDGVTLDMALRDLARVLACRRGDIEEPPKSLRCAPGRWDKSAVWAAAKALRRRDPDITLRAIAHELGMAEATLYWHVTKRELDAELAEEASRGAA